MFISISYVPGMCFGTIPSNGHTSLRGFAKKKIPKIRVYYGGAVGGRVQVSRIFLETHPKIALNQYGYLE